MDGDVTASIGRLLDGLDTLDHVGLADRLQDAERCARLIESIKVSIVAHSERRDAYTVDGHRSVRNWIEATITARRQDATDLVRLASLCSAHPAVFDHLHAASLPLAAAHALAKVHSNPRVADQLGDVIEAFIVVGQRAPHPTFMEHLRNWERLADIDGPDPDPHQRRRASCTSIDGTTFLRAELLGVAGAEVAEILERFTHAEFAAEWDELRAELGDEACPGRLRRSDAQRRADAVVAVFRRAASADPTQRDPEPVVNIVTHQDVFDEQLRSVIEAREPNFDLLEPTRVWSETHNGVALAPSDVLAAAAVGHVRRIVVDDDGLIIDFGRRRRLFTGAAKHAADLQHALDRANRCLWPGCGHRRTQHDHTDEWHRDRGTTSVRNEGPICGRHNVIKTRGYRTWRDPHGTWHTYRPDGTEITSG